MKNRSLYLVILALVVASLACSQLTVVSESVLPFSAQVSLPDGSSHLVYLTNGMSKSWGVFEGGAYQVSVVSTERHIQFMNNVRDAAFDAMLGENPEGLYGMILGPDADVYKAFNAFVETEGVIEGERKGVTCTGELPYQDLNTLTFDLTVGAAENETVVIGYSEADLAYTCTN
jgi:hypothetical protein